MSATSDGWLRSLFCPFGVSLSQLRFLQQFVSHCLVSLYQSPLRIYLQPTCFTGLLHEQRAFVAVFRMSWPRALPSCISIPSVLCVWQRRKEEDRKRLEERERGAGEGGLAVELPATAATVNKPQADR